MLSHYSSRALTWMLEIPYWFEEVVPCQPIENWDILGSDPKEFAELASIMHNSLATKINSQNGRKEKASQAIQQLFTKLTVPNANLITKCTRRIYAILRTDVFA